MRSMHISGPGLVQPVLINKGQQPCRNTVAKSLLPAWTTAGMPAAQVQSRAAVYAVVFLRI